MRMLLNEDGTINAIGYVDSYPFKAPEYVSASGHNRWQFTGDPELLIEPVKGSKESEKEYEQRLEAHKAYLNDPANFQDLPVNPEEKAEEAKRILDQAYQEIAAIIELPVDKAHDFVKDDLVERGKVEVKDETIEVPVETKI